MHPLFLIHFPEGLQLIWIGIFLILFFLPFIFYLLTLQNMLKLIAPNNRKMPPGQVWLVLIPLFGAIWQFFVVNNISISIEKEFRSKGLPIENRPTYTIGLITCILCALNTAMFIFGLHSFLVTITACICLIIYWVKVAGYKNKLLMSQYNQGQPNQDSKYFTK